MHFFRAEGLEVAPQPLFWCPKSSDAPVSVNINGTDYYYVKNLQGDIIALLDGQGSCVVKYTYDAWGKVLSVEDSTETNIGTINPLRYRGYYYDSDLGFYYLRSRYYDPTVGRFLNADDIAVLTMIGDSTLGCNLYTYVFNNPINETDSTGYLVNAVIGAITGAVLSAVTYFIEYWLGMRYLNWWAFAGIVGTAAALGAFGGYISGWVKFAKLAKHAQLPGLFKKLRSPLVRNLVTWSVRGVKFMINGFVKKLSRKPGESWVTAVRRWLKI